MEANTITPARYPVYPNPGMFRLRRRLLWTPPLQDDVVTD